MANGVLAISNLVAATNTVVYTCPAGKTATVAVNMCATSASTLVRVALVKGVDTGYIEYDYPLGPAGSAENSMCFRAVVVDAGEQVMLRAKDAGVHAVLTGYEMPQNINAIDA